MATTVIGAAEAVLCQIALWWQTYCQFFDPATLVPAVGGITDTAIAARVYGTLLLKWAPVNLALYASLHVILIATSHYYRDVYTDSGRRLYILKNLSKSIILCYLVTLFSPMMHQVLFYNIWPANGVFYELGTVYVVTDVTGLLLVRLPLRTRIHHTCVLILGFCNIMSDYQLDGIHRALIYLTYLSMAAYIVNTYLALRYVAPEGFNRLLASAACVVYAISIGMNMVCQHMAIWTDITNRYYGTSTINQAMDGVADIADGGWFTSIMGVLGGGYIYAYTAMYWMILMDDMILLCFLWNNSWLSSVKTTERGSLLVKKPVKTE